MPRVIFQSAGLTVEAEPGTNLLDAARRLGAMCVIVAGGGIGRCIDQLCLNQALFERQGVSILGLLLTGGFVPHLSIVNMLCTVDVPVLLTDDDTATAAFEIRSLVSKIAPRDVDKIEFAERMIEEHVDVDRMFKAVGLTPPVEDGQDTLR